MNSLSPGAEEQRQSPHTGFRASARDGWLGAILPVDASRFRVHDSHLATILEEAGAAFVDHAPDVEIGPAAELVGDAPFVVVPLHAEEPRSASRLLRAGQRLARASRIRTSATRACRLLRDRGYTIGRVLVWERSDPLIERGARPPRGRPLAHRFRLNAVVAGGQDGIGQTMLDAAIAQARGRVSPSMAAEPAVLRSSGVVSTALGSSILRLAVGPATGLLFSQQASLTALGSADLDPAVTARIPVGAASGKAGLAAWTLERKLPGDRPAAPLSSALVDDCVAFLIGLYHAGRDVAPQVDLTRSGATVASACPPHTATAVTAVARRLQHELADVPRGYAHGDFWPGNLLAERGRLSGVVDWAAAGPGRLPLLDLITLQVDIVQVQSGLSMGSALVRYAAADPARDEPVRAYCERLGMPLDGRRIRQLLTAYWLDAVARRLVDSAVDPHQSFDAAWRRQNIDVILSTIAEDGSLASA